MRPSADGPSGFYAAHSKRLQRKEKQYEADHPRTRHVYLLLRYALKANNHELQWKRGFHEQTAGLRALVSVIIRHPGLKTVQHVGWPRLGYDLLAPDAMLQAAVAADAGMVLVMKHERWAFVPSRVEMQLSMCGRWYGLRHGTPDCVSEFAWSSQDCGK